jgi:hypothetical protein
VVSAGPTGEIRAGEEGNEIRVVFSEPMVALGRVPPRLKPAFFHITPAVTGTYRWSGTTILILTPAKRLPLATKYDVTIDAAAAAISGRKLAAPYTFSFMTPTAVLLQTNWYRPGGRFDAAPVIVLRFNQPVKPEDVAAHIRGGFERHEFQPPVIPAAAQARLRAIDPAAVPAFNDKVERARAAANATSPVVLEVATDWDKKRFKPSPDMVVLQAKTPVPPESWIRLDTDGRIPSLAGLAVSGRPQNYTIQVEETFLVTSFDCQSGCDPDNRNPIVLRRPVKADAFAAALKVTDVSEASPARVLGAGRVRRTDGRRRRLPAAAARDEVPGDAAGRPEGGRRADPGLHVGRPGRDLASARVHELWRRPRRLGKGRRLAPAVLRAEFSLGEAMGRGRRTRAADADAPAAPELAIQDLATEPAHYASPERDTRSDSVPRPGSGGRAEAVGNRPRVDRGGGGHADRERARVEDAR